MNGMYAKYGLNGQAFATLPNLKRYRLFKQKEKHIVTLDIQKEIAALTSKTDTLQVTVPTMGFTDPLLDYSALPRFAIPLSINGYVADEENPGKAKATVWGKDISGEATLLHPQKDVAAFTTLRAITYVFSADHIRQGQGLVKIASEQVVGMMEFWLCYPAKTPLAFLLEVKNDKGQVILSRDICYYPPPYVSPKANFWISETITCNALVCDPHSYFRSRWVCDLQLKDTTLRLTHYAGLSLPATRALLEHLIPFAHFFSIFAEKNPKQSAINRYDLYPEHQRIFYEHLLESILDQSLPLLALQDYFAPDAHHNLALQKLSEEWDDHDKCVFQSAQNSPSLEAFVDALDELIVLRDPLFTAHLHPSLGSEDHELQDIQVNLALEDKQGHWTTIPAELHCQETDSANFSAYATIVKEGTYSGLRRK